MVDKTIESRYTNKKKQLEKECLYGLKHFCDGTPNRSMVNTDKPKPPCTKYRSCTIRKVKIFKTLRSNDYDE